jgi:integrase
MEPQLDIDATCEWVAASDLRPATKTAYVQNLRRFAQDPAFLDDPVAFLEARFTHGATLLSRVGSLVALHRKCPHFDLGASLEYALLLLDALKDANVEQYERRERRDNDVDWTDVQAAESRLEPRDLLLFRCLTRLPPQRCADYSNMRIVEDDDGRGNVFARSTQEFVFRDYKTSKRRGIKVVSVPDEIAELVPDQSYLFEARGGGPVGYRALSKRISSMFSRAGLHAGSIALRRSFASKQLKEGLEGVDLARASASMDHTTRTHRWYAFKD